MRDQEGRFSLRTALSVVLLAAICSSAALADAPTASDVLGKALGKLDHAKTYQATVEVRSQSGFEEQTLTIKLRVENDGHGQLRRGALSTSTTEEKGGASSVEMQTMIDDGQMETDVDPQRREYSRAPRTGDRVSGLRRPILARCTGLVGELAVETHVLGGRLAYVLTRDAPAATVKIVVDKATVHLESIHAVRRDGPVKVVTDVTVSNQVFDAPIPDSVFAWRPPKGYREVPAGAERRR